uniref:calcium-binding protein n=1 Tax=Synechococcus sp. UW106 TaxID=368495 RepID=UPI0010BD22AD|nr:calcium-binding protein [Synechococcus sp. UW106]
MTSATHKKMATTVRDSSTYEMTYFVSDGSTGDVNYLYEGGEDYFFGSNDYDVLIINAESSDYEINSIFGTNFTSVNPTSLFDRGSIVASSLDAIEFRDKTIELDSINYRSIVTYRDELGSSKFDDNVGLGAYQDESKDTWHNYFYRGGDDVIQGTTSRMEGIVINANSSEYEIFETSAGITYIEPTGLYNYGSLELTNIDAIYFNDTYFTLEPLERDFPLPTNLRGTNGNEDLLGGRGDDELVGLRGRDYLNGFEGNDELRAGNGRDTIIGGEGADDMYGGFGHNTFKDALDGEVDKLFFKSDQFAYNYVYDKAGNNADGQKVDIIEELDSFDQIMIQGVETDQLSFGYVSNLATPSGQQSGIGIYADGFIEGLYTGDNLGVDQLSQMTMGVPA